ncbi:MAG TPA: YeeE/YedE thiosulfate transporter family protein [Polyangiaceae bacterium]|nr:YeeE/YedE thiosulfate transporter family protein [Polyangiaceae bacterium]
MIELTEALAVGFAFGWLLQKAGLSRYERIVGVYRFKDLAVVKVLLTALLVGAACLRAMTALGLAGAVPIPATYFAGNVAGGVVFGIGMAVSGFCPGTVAAGAGEGRLDYLIPGMLGLIAGALTFGVIYPWVLPLVSIDVRPGLTLARWLDVDPWLVLLVLAELVLLVFYLIESHRTEAPHDGNVVSAARGGTPRRAEST